MANEKIDVQKSNKALIWTGIIAILFIAALLTNGFGLFGKNITGGTIVSGNAVPLSIGESPIIGSPDAKLTIYEFTDFSCPYCQRFALQTLPEIEKEYIETGKAKIVVKYFPGHGAAKQAHIVALAMNEQGLFEKFHNAVFTAPSEDLNNLGKMKSLAESLGADMNRLENDIENNNYDSQLQADIAMGTSNGIRATPSFIINGEKIEGALPFSEFQKAIEKAL